MNKIISKKKLLYILLSFLLLFIARLIYGYIAYPDGRITTSNNIQIDTVGFDLERKNYASKKMIYKQQTTTVDQKYEKVGSLTNITNEYEKSKKSLYQLIKTQELMIQLEQFSGLPQSRRLNIALGVIPHKFEKIIQKLKTIGELRHIQIDKKDKTNEYKKLEAQRVSLQKARESLLELKQSGGNVAEMIQLTERLLSLEESIQNLGISLGEFDAKNEFCTVKFTLREYTKAKPEVIALTNRLKVALVWTFEIYIGFFIMAIFVLLALWLFFVITEKISKNNHS